jgi:predicted HicB family RNase H-like nuclease
MNTMSYRGYTARIDFDDRDNLFVGRVLGLRSIISFHGQTVEELRAQFAVAMDDYVADCQEQGVSPEKPASGKLLLRVSPEIHSQALIKAQAVPSFENQGCGRRDSPRSLSAICATVPRAAWDGRAKI